MKYSYVIAFVILALVQWALPGRTIWEKDQVRKKGQLFKFQTEPVDPSNPFKGKYITLNFAENSFTDTLNRGLNGNDQVYVILAKNPQGFVIVQNISVEQPESTNAYVRAQVYYVSSEKDSITVHLHYPFDEFYMDEYKAPKAENIYRESSRNGASTTYASVKILNGDAVVENVYINDVPIGQLIK
ncbi:MAG TPA: GDYXXLXY domain-containing protein [Flavitalea sp.]|nr:GDYXXLXY domain-containing protein [Flavitalea sp.]